MDQKRKKKRRKIDRRACEIYELYEKERKRRGKNGRNIKEKWKISSKHRRKEKKGKYKENG